MANTICPGGTSENSASRSAGIHHAVSNSRFGRSAGHPPDPGQVADPGVGEDQPGVRELLGELDGVQAEGRDAAAGVDQHRQRALVGERDQGPDRRVIERELLGAGMQLDPRAPASSARSASGRGSSCGLTRQNGTSSPSGSRAAASTASLAGAVAVGLVEREHERAAGVGRLRARRSARRRSASSRPGRSARGGCGRRTARAREPARAPPRPGAQCFDQVHRWIRTMKPDDPVAHRPLAPRRRRDPQPRRAGAAGRDRQLVRAPAGQAPRRRAGRLGDGVELRGALPQRAYLPRVAAASIPTSTRCRCSCSATTPT